MTGALPTHIGIRLATAYPALGPLNVPGTEPSRAGYLVTLDGRESWVPSERFEQHYQGVGAMDFARALFALLSGNAVARKVWRNSERIVARDDALWLEVPGCDAKRWRPDQTEVFASDWMVVP